MISDPDTERPDVEDRLGPPCARVLSAVQMSASMGARNGGPVTAIENINVHLRRIGSKSLILTTDSDGKYGPLRVNTNRPVESRGAMTWFCHRSRPHTLYNSWIMPWRAVRSAWKADIIHIHGVYLANSIYGYLASRITGTPYVLQPHGTLEPYQQAFGARKKAVFNRIIGDRIIVGAAEIIAASRSEADNIIGQYPRSTVAVIPLGVTDQVPSKPSVTPCLERWLSAPREKRVIFLGRLARKKRPELLASAWREMGPGSQLLFVGPAQDWTEQSLRAHLPDQADPTVNFLPAVDPTEVAWCLRQAGIFVLPSENENFGIAVVEAMANGCAVLSTHDTAASEHVLAAEAGVILDRPDASRLRTAMLSLLAEPALISEMGQRGRRYAGEHLTWSATVVKLQAAYSRATQIH